MKVTVCQMNDDRDEFAKDWKKLSSHVKRSSSDLVLLPEMPFSKWFCHEPKFNPRVWAKAVREHRDWMKRISELGAKVVIGSSPVDKRGGGRFNEGWTWTEKGAKEVHVKSYLPDEPGYYEARWYQRGDRDFSPFIAGDAKAGLMICSDIWSMWHARSYGKNGAQLVAVPHAAPKQSVEKWVAAGRVVGVLAGAYCLGSNRCGRGGGLEFGGSSWVTTPNGKILGLTTDDKPFLTAEIDLGEADEAKKTYPRDALEPD